MQPENAKTKVLRKAYRFRLEPNVSQSAAFEQYAGCSRFVFNWALDQRKQYYEATGKTIGFVDQANQLPALKKQFQFLAESPSQVLQQSLKDLDRAYQNFFKGLAAFPTFHKKGQRDSFRVPQGFGIVEKFLRLPKVGEVKMRLSQEIEGTPKNVTISKRGNHWFAAIQVEIAVLENVVQFEQEPTVKSEVGIDMGVRNLATLSDGTIIKHPDFSKLERKRRKAQRSLSRKRKGSKNFQKAKKKLGRISIRIADKRLDTIHKATTTISKNHAVVYVEDLNVKGMSASAKGNAEEHGKNVRQKAGLNRSILSQGWSEFRRQLTYKLEWNGNKLVPVDPRHTSQTCSHPSCGHTAKENRLNGGEVFSCVKCGHTLDADVNAAINILAVGQTVSACGDIRRVAS